MPRQRWAFEIAEVYSRRFILEEKLPSEINVCVLLLFVLFTLYTGFVFFPDHWICSAEFIGCFPKVRFCPLPLGCYFGVRNFPNGNSFVSHAYFICQSVQRRFFCITCLLSQVYVGKLLSSLSEKDIV